MSGLLSHGRYNRHRCGTTANDHDFFISIIELLWPFLWIWATLWRDDRGWGFNHLQQEHDELAAKVADLTATVDSLQAQLNTNNNQGKN